MFKKITLSFFLCFIYGISCSINIDSLQMIIDKMPDDTIKANFIINSLEEIYSKSPELAKKYCLYSAKFCNKIKFVKGEAKSFGILAYIYLKDEKKDSNLFYIKKAIQLLENNNHGGLLSKLHNNAGIAYFKMNNYEKSIEYFTKCANYYLKINDSTGYYIARANIASIFSTKKQYIEEEKILRESLAYFIKKKYW